MTLWATRLMKPQIGRLRTSMLSHKYSRGFSTVNPLQGLNLNRRKQLRWLGTAH